MSAEPARKLSAAQRAALARIESLIEFWRITPDELDGPLPPVAPSAPPQRVKYRHPVSGETWDGEGLQPEWLRQALSKEGYRVAELLPAGLDGSAD
jgi:DNA-binding protein H-NS